MANLSEPYTEWELRDSRGNFAELISGSTGEVFIRSLLEYLAETLEVEWAFVAESGQEEGKIGTIAYWAAGDSATDLTQSVREATYAHVINHPIGGRVLKPSAALRACGVHGCAGALLAGSGGRITGVLAVVDRRPLKDPATAESLLGIFAPRVAAELERRHMDEALRESDKRLRLLAEHTRDVIFRYRLRPELRLEYVSPAVEAVTGYTPQELYRDHLLLARILSAEDWEVVDSLRQEIRSDVRGPRLLRCVRKDGTVLWTENQYHSVREPDGEIVAIEGICRDVTERQSAQEQLELQTIALDAAGRAVAITDRCGRITQVNRAFTELSGYEPVEAIGKQLDFLTDQGAGGTLGSALWETVGGGDVWAGEVVSRHKDGSSYREEMTVTPVGEPEITHFVVVKRDATESREWLQEARRARQSMEQQWGNRTEQLERANREMESFVHSVSHDLRAPLRGIEGFAQALMEDYGGRLDEVGHDYLRRLQAASQRMGHLIDDLLELSKASCNDLRREEVDLSAVAQGIAGDMGRRQPDRQVEFVIAEGAVVQADPPLIRAVIQNLFENAWKYTGRHARARIEFGVKEGEGGRIYFVRDDGAGFDMADASKLFNPFQRLHAPSDFEGTGIGLATVRRIIERHGGWAWGEGWVERGATFYFSLGGDCHTAPSAAKQPVRQTLCLYLAGITTSSRRAIEEAKSICEYELGDQYEVKVVDVLRDPVLGGSDRVVSTPSAIERLPPPLQRVVGYLADRKKVLLGLDLRETSQ